VGVNEKTENQEKKTHRRTDINSLDAITPRPLLGMRHRVGHHNLPQPTAVQRLDGVSTEDSVRDNRDGFLGAVLDDHVCGFHERAARVGHVVDDDCNLAGDVAYQDHAGYFIGAGALLVD